MTSLTQSRSAVLRVSHRHPYKPAGSNRHAAPRPCTRSKHRTRSNVDSITERRRGCLVIPIRFWFRAAVVRLPRKSLLLRWLCLVCWWSRKCNITHISATSVREHFWVSVSKPDKPVSWRKEPTSLRWHVLSDLLSRCRKMHPWKVHSLTLDYTRWARKPVKYL